MLRLLPLWLSLAGCGTTDIGCDFRDGSVNGPEPRCQERTGVQAPGFEVVCEQLDATAWIGGCPTEGRVGGCRLGGDVAGGAVVDWFYPPETAASAEALCLDEGAEFLSTD